MPFIKMNRITTDVQLSAALNSCFKEVFKYEVFISIMKQLQQAHLSLETFKSLPSEIV